jgi:hypothetical protein
VCLAIPPEPGLVRFVRLVSVALARINSVADDVLDDVRLATGEACSRAVAAHRTAGLDAPVVVEIRGGRSLSIVVRDLQALPAATGMQAADVLRQSVVAAPVAHAGAGTGDAWLTDAADEEPTLPEAIGLIVGLADDVIVETGPRGTSVTMTWAASP